MTQPTIRDYDAELDRVMRVNSYWRDMEREEGREVAKLELMYEMACIEADRMRSDEREEEEKRNLIIRSELNAYLNHRDNFEGTFEELINLDAEFVRQQAAKGFNVSYEINKLQESERRWIKWHQEQTEHKRFLAEIAAEKRAEKIADMSLFAELIAKKIGKENWQILKAWAAAGGRL